MNKKALLLALICYLGVHNGHLALFDEKAPEPLLVFPYRIEAFSQKDQAALKNGIPYLNNAELTHILEDFLS